MKEPITARCRRYTASCIASAKSANDAIRHATGTRQARAVRQRTPCRVFAWDITKLHGPQKWTYYYLYVIIDIYSRYVVGWMVADRESSRAGAHSALGRRSARSALDPVPSSRCTPMTAAR